MSGEHCTNYGYDEGGIPHLLTRDGMGSMEDDSDLQQLANPSEDSPIGEVLAQPTSEARYLIHTSL